MYISKNFYFFSNYFLLHNTVFYKKHILLVSVWICECIFCKGNSIVILNRIILQRLVTLLLITLTFDKLICNVPSIENIPHKQLTDNPKLTSFIVRGVKHINKKVNVQMISVIVTGDKIPLSHMNKIHSPVAHCTSFYLSLAGRFLPRYQLLQVAHHT